MKSERRTQKAKASGRGAKLCPASGGTVRFAGADAEGFTLVEMILVMAVLVVILAVVAPSLSATMRGRIMTEQAARLLALTEYSRDEAASQGVPMVVWVDPDTRRFGAALKVGYVNSALRTKEYTLPADLNFDPVAGAQASKTGGHGFDVAEFEPDGTMDPASAPSVRIANRQRTNGVSIAQTVDGYGYQIVREAGR